MLGRTSSLIALYVLAVIITMTSTDARSHHVRHHLRGEDRPRGGRQRGSGSGSGERQAYANHHNRTRPAHTKDDDDDDLLDLMYDDGEKGGGRKVPSLHAMQTFGLTPSSSSSSSSERKERRPIRGSHKAVLVTKKTYLKKEWCKTQPLKQVIRVRGCLRTKILNNFCYGQCNSFFIPKKARRDKDAEAFLSCGFCRPRRVRWVLVTLRCPSKNGLRFKRKRVQYIKKCRCMAQDVSMPPMS
ncbi:gremlin-2-like [Littorina saxatilis]|uniref:CTCK domain-containing protein n=1 Tax=Littorina saxatilis TaxID=31220 RepID=A0AAN9BDE9_9CAEN